VRHTIAGNRMRMAGRVRLRADVEWQEKMSPWDRWLCWTLAGWKLRQYGYEKDPPRDAGGRLKPPEAVRGDSPLLTGAQSKAA